MQVSISNGISIHINMNVVIGIYRSFNVTFGIGTIHRRIRLNISVNACINAGIIFNILSMSVLVLVIA